MANFFGKQFIDVIEWKEPEGGILSYRFPMHNLGIKHYARLTVNELQMAMFVSEGKIADVFGPGRYTLNVRVLPIMAGLMNWKRHSESPFRSEVFFFSSRVQTEQKWGTSVSITFRDKEFGAVRLRAFGNYSYRVADVRSFFNKVSGPRAVCLAADIDGQLRNSIQAHIADGLSNNKVPFRVLATNRIALAERIGSGLRPAFAALGLELVQFIVTDVSIPEELAKNLKQPIGRKIVSDMSRNMQHAAGGSLDLSAASTGGRAGSGLEPGAGDAAAQAFAGPLRPPVVGTLVPTATAVASAEGTKFCIDCGKTIPLRARSCAECGRLQ